MSFYEQIKKSLGLLMALVITVSCSWADSPWLGQGFCQGGETWKLSSSASVSAAIDPQFFKLFNQTLDRKITPAMGFSNAFALRRAAFEAGPRAIAEYWMARALLNADLVHIAHNGFTALASRKPTPVIAHAQLGSLGCLLEIQEDYPSLTLSKKIQSNLPALKTASKKSPELAGLYHQALFQWFTDQLAQGVPSSRLQQMIDLSDSKQPEHSYMDGLRLLAQTDYPAAIKKLEEGLQLAQTSSRRQRLKKHQDAIHLMLSRAHFSIRNYKTAIQYHSKVSKRSNDLADSLSELAWAHLKNKNYREAIGTAINLQSGGLRATFTPEAPMVMAMSLNELCQYPQSLRAIDLFRKNYGMTFQWLDQWVSSEESKKLDLYQAAIHFISSDERDFKRLTHGLPPVPERIASEWVRSPRFLSRQGELNLIVDENASTRKIGNHADHEQKKTATLLLLEANRLYEKYKMAKINLKPGEAMSKALLEKIAELKFNYHQYERLRRAAPLWKKILGHHIRYAKQREVQLKHEIRKDFAKLNFRMHRQLMEIAENNHFIEVEIFNGATKDIIWHNAHPDYEKVANELKANNQKVKASRVWNWGDVSAGLDGTGEIWEDELGSFKANIYNNCTNKKKYLALKRERMINRLKARQNRK